jgi:hypothetical protein
MQTSYGCIFQKKTSVAAINITLGVPGPRADKDMLEVMSRIAPLYFNEAMARIAPRRPFYSTRPFASKFPSKVLLDLIRNCFRKFT